MIKPCEKCGKLFTAYPSNIKRGKNKYCSRVCSDVGRVETNCKICNKLFTTHQCKLDIGKGKYCSRKCYEISKKGVPSWNKGKSAPWMLGNKYRTGKGNPNPHKMFDNDNHKWKGDKVGYRALHYWVERQLGKPKECEFCKTKIGKFHWANKSKRYLREADDWIRLCVKCHRQYDS